MRELDSFWKIKYDWELGYPVVWCYGSELVAGTFPSESITVEYQDKNESTFDWPNGKGENKYKIPYRIVVHAYTRDITNPDAVTDLQKRALLRIAQEIVILIDHLERAAKTVTELNGLHLYSVDQSGKLERK